jgi:hypothetical protein
MHAILLRGKRESPHKGKALSPGVLGRISAVSCWAFDERLGRRPAHVSCEAASFLLAVGRRAGDRALVPVTVEPFFAGGRSKNSMFENRGRNVALCATAVREGNPPDRRPRFWPTASSYAR